MSEIQNSSEIVHQIHEYYHDLQYFVGALVHLSVVNSGQENDRHLLLKRLNDIRSISVIISAKTNFLKYVASDISHHAYCDIAVHRVLRRLTSGLLQIPAALNKKLKIKLEGESFSTIHGPDIFEFIPYLVLENAVKYSPSHERYNSNCYRNR
jgi:hypothetical protein